MQLQGLAVTGPADGTAGRPGGRAITPYRQKMRSEIIRSAQQLFLTKGFTGVSIDDVMAGAGLTRGGFYTYFDNKSALYAEAVRDLMQEKLAASSPRRASQLIRECLAGTWPDGAQANLLLAHPGDLLLNDDAISITYEAVVKFLIQMMDAGTNADGGRRQRALSIVAMLIGCMTAARSLRDTSLVESMRAAVLNAALELGGWSNEEANGPEDDQQQTLSCAAS